VLHISAAAIGLAPLLRSAPTLLDAVRILGAAYLVYLGVRALSRRDEGAGAEGDRDPLTGSRGYCTGRPRGADSTSPRDRSSSGSAQRSRSSDESATILPRGIAANRTPGVRLPVASEHG
jgi:LysE type translocator